MKTVQNTRKISVLMSGPLSPPVGGMATYCEDYLKSSLAEEFDVTLSRAPRIKGIFTARGLSRFVLRVLNSIVVMTGWVLLLLTRRPAIAHVHTNSYGGFYVKAVMALLARMTGAKTLLHIHGGEFKKFYAGMNFMARRITRPLINLNSRVIVLSQEWYEFYKSIGVEEKRLVVMPNSVYLPDIPPSKEGSGKPRVLFLSRLERAKGVFELIDALEKDPDLLEKCNFILAGPKSAEWKTFGERIDRLTASGAFKVLEPVAGEEKDRLYRQADIYLLPSYAEGLPIGLLEAMSYGLACITTPVGGIPQVITDRRNGLLILPGDSEQLTQAIELLVSDSKLFNSIGREARLTIELSYNWENRAKELAELYRKLI